MAYNRAHPPPTTIPSSTAALVAFNASVILSFISPTSTSDAPPTFITPTPPYNFARRSANFSLSYSLVLNLIYSLIYVHLSEILSFDPEPCITIVSSLVIIIFLADPSTDGSDFSNVSPTSSVMTVPPVNIAISFKIALRLSPNAGALTAEIFRPPLSLFNTSYANTSLSKSSAIMTNGLFSFTTCSSK